MVLSGWALWKGRRNPHGHPTFALASSGLFQLGLAAISLGMLALFLDLAPQALRVAALPHDEAVVADVVGRVDPPARLSRARRRRPPRPAAMAARAHPAAAAARRGARHAREAARRRLRLDRHGRGARHLHRRPALGARRAAALVERPPRPAVPRLRPLDERGLRALGLARGRRARAARVARQPVPLGRARPDRPLPDRPPDLDRGERRGCRASSSAARTPRSSGWASSSSASCCRSSSRRSP